MGGSRLEGDHTFHGSWIGRDGQRGLRPAVSSSDAVDQRAAAVRHAQRASGQAAALAGMIAARDGFSEVAQQLLATRGSLDSLLVRLVEVELCDCLPSREVRDEVDSLLRTALGRAGSGQGASRSRHRRLTTAMSALRNEERNTR